MSFPVFKGFLYAGDWNENKGDRIRRANGAREWERVKKRFMNTKIYCRHSVNFSGRFFRPVLNLIKEEKLLDGSFVKEFEDKFATYIGVKHAAGVSSGRIGLYLALEALGLHKGDEIIVPDYTLHSIPALIKGYGLEPVFVDICERTYNIDVSLIKKNITTKTKAILATHLFGQPCAIASVMEIARQYGLKVVEDCAQSCGAEYAGKKSGSFGDIAFFSFNIGKNLCCAGGGMVVANDDLLWNKINTLRNAYGHQKKIKLLSNIFRTGLMRFSTSRAFFPYTLYPALRFMDFLSIDFLDRLADEKVVAPIRALPKCPSKLSNLQAMIGLMQLVRLDAVNHKMRANGGLITRELSGQSQIKLPLVISEALPIYLYYRIEVKNRERFRRSLLKKGIDTRSDDMTACSMLEIFKDRRGCCPISEKAHLNSLEIPNSPYLEESDIMRICQGIREAIQSI